MPGESDNPHIGAGKDQTNGSRIEVSLVDLIPPPQVDLASRGPHSDRGERSPRAGDQ